VSRETEEPLGLSRGAAAGFVLGVAAIVNGGLGGASRLLASLWRHPDPNIESGDPSVDVGLDNQLANEECVLPGISKSGWMTASTGLRRPRTDCSPSIGHRRGEAPRGDRHCSDLLVTEIASGSQRHSGNAALGCAVGDVATCPLNAETDAVLITQSPLTGLAGA
jgi:hypothetical protein